MFRNHYPQSPAVLLFALLLATATLTFVVPLSAAAESHTFSLTAFTNFGLAWHQSIFQITSGGTATVKIQTILLDQNFGFDPDVSLAPTNTFHVGFWFDDPLNAFACGFTGSTPFNAGYVAGPLAMISLPDPVANLGPLCTNPDASTNPPSCNLNGFDY